MELYKQNGWAFEQVELLHYRDKYQHEVDIILERHNQQLIGIKIKTSATINRHDFKALTKLAELNPKQFQYGAIFYSGKDILSFSQQDIKLLALPISLLLQ